MKILIVTDAWKPQVNGVVRTLDTISKELIRLGHDVRIIGPDSTQPFVFPIPFYRSIVLEFLPHARLKETFRIFSPDYTHIATEGPLGWAARSLCLHQGRPFTTSYHTSFPEYLAERSPHLLAPLISMATFAVLRRFHAPAGVVMVATTSIEKELRRRKFYRLVRWSRGVDTNLFKPCEKTFGLYEKLPRPILLSVGRVAVEKNLRAFLALQTPGSKVVVGDGPDLDVLRAEYPDTHFLGGLSGEALGRAYAAADLFVFPSKTDTFGLVLLEACASGLRVAAYPVMGPADVFADERSKAFAVLDENLQNAVDRALALPDNPEIPRAFASTFSWAASAEQFFTHLQAPSPRAKKRLARWRKKIG
jgi:glycosyltransferase involved in cell wall biosynthesis